MIFWSWTYYANMYKIINESYIIRVNVYVYKIGILLTTVLWIDWIDNMAAYKEETNICNGNTTPVILKLYTIGMRPCTPNESEMS